MRTGRSSPAWRSCRRTATSWRRRGGIREEEEEEGGGGTQRHFLNCSKGQLIHLRGKAIVAQWIQEGGP